MAESFVSIDGQPVRSMTLRIPQSGCWTAEIIMTGSPALDGTLNVDVDGTVIRGTVVASMAGSYVGTTGVKLVGGYGGWSKALPAKHYHNDGAGVRALVVAQDAARECGEQLGSFVPASERLGVDYVRTASVPAVKALEDAAQGNLWWVELDGSTTAGVRAKTELDPTACPTLAFDPINRVAVIGVDGIESIAIGSIVTQYVDAPQTIREIVITVSVDEPLRAKVWCGGSDLSAGRLVSLLEAIVRRATDKPLYGVYRYRVTSRVGTRIEAESASADMPNVRPIAMWPGVAGCYADLAAGAEILITFIDGDPTQPVIVGFGPIDHPGFIPDRLVLGGTVGNASARVGDVVKVAPGLGQTITLAGGGAGSGTYTFSFSPVPVPGSTPAAALVGSIVTGSHTVEVGG
jgi:hypothetical protein